MGLDNIPRVTPCRKHGTAVLTDLDRVDCTATQAEGGCPWQTRFETDHPGIPVLGIFGADCWYRGKMGTHMLATLAEAGHELPEHLEGGFYGPASEGFDADYALELSTWMADHAEAYSMAVAGNAWEGDVEHAVEQYRYAAWWLRFVAEEAEGADAWW